MRLRLLVVSIALMGLAVVVGPDSQPGRAGSTDEATAAMPRAADTRVGRVQGTEAYIAVRDDGQRLRVERLHPDGRISGRLDGHRFTADPVTGPAGLVERDGRRSVVLADGSVRAC